MFHYGTALRIPVNILFSILNSIEDRFEFWVRYDMFSLLGEVVYFFSAGCAFQQHDPLMGKYMV